MTIIGEVLHDGCGRFFFCVLPTHELTPEIRLDHGFDPDDHMDGWAVYKYEDERVNFAKFVPGAHFPTMEEAQQYAMDNANGTMLVDWETRLLPPPRETKPAAA